MFEFAKNFLVADIGGTNARFAVIDSKQSIIIKKIYKTREKKNFDDVMRSFIDEVDMLPNRVTIYSACFAIAGSVNNDRQFAQLTNVPWTFDAKEIKKKYGFKNVIFLNDFEAVGFGIDTLKPNQYTELTSYGHSNTGTISLIGAGTGLGMGILVENGKKHLPLPSEGGHMDVFIRPDNSLELQLYNYLKKKELILDNESIVSGRGITNIYEFLITKKIKHSKKISTEIKKSNVLEKPSLITKYALEEKDVLCLKTMELFTIFYARIAKNLAILTLCSELVIAGGIAPKVIGFLKDGFIESFKQTSHRHLRNWLENMTILVITDEDVSLYGAYNALKMMNN